MNTTDISIYTISKHAHAILQHKQKHNYILTIINYICDDLYKQKHVRTKGIF